MSALLRALAGGDRRSIGKSTLVVRAIGREPARFAEIIDGLTSDDPLIRMRCADVAEKVSRARPEWLRPHKRRLLALAGRAVEKELRWHFAQMLPRLPLGGRERLRAAAILFAFLGDDSRIVKTFAMQALADLARGDPALRRQVLPLIEALGRTGSPAMRARARKLIGDRP